MRNFLAVAATIGTLYVLSRLARMRFAWLDGQRVPRGQKDQAVAAFLERRATEPGRYWPQSDQVPALRS